MGREIITTSHEKEFSPEIHKEGEKQRERLHEDLERRAEATKETSIESIRKEALEHSLAREKEAKEHETLKSPEAPLRAIKKSPSDSFNDTMTEVRSQLSPAGKTFSKVIHNKTVEKISDGIGTTIARPNAILSGAIFAFCLTLGIYLIAKNLGYPLSGFETIAAFTLGWALGIIYDFLKVMITGRK